MAGTVWMLMSTISGTGDTTATTVMAALYYLIRNPECLAKLRDELRQAGIGGLGPRLSTEKDFPSFADVGKLPYLNAVIGEAMRLFPSATWPMERLVPVGGAIIAGMFSIAAGECVNEWETIEYNKIQRIYSIWIYIKALYATLINGTTST